MGKYTALVIGAGGQGSQADQPGSGNEHKIISFAHALKEHEGFEIAGFVDIDFKKAEKAAETWGGKWFKFIEDATDVDVAVVATPDDGHAFCLIHLALELKPKLVICEKPICTDLQQAREIVALYKAKSIPLMVNYTRRFLPYYEDLKRRYGAGEFGHLIKARALFNRGWAHTGTHVIDFFTWLNDGHFRSDFEIREVGADYRVWLIEMFFGEYYWREERIGEQPVWPYYDQAMLHVVNNAYEYLEGREALKCSGEDALKTLEICYNLYDPNRKGRN